MVFVGAFAVVVLAGLVLAYWNVGGPEARRRDREVEPDPRDLEPEVRHPYRARVRRVAMRFTPRVSGAGTAAVVAASFAFAAVALPLSLQLPRWIEAEAVLGLWWIALSTTFAVLLFRGYRLKDDFFFVPFWKRPKVTKGAKGAAGNGAPDLGCPDLGCGGCGDPGEAVIVFLALAVVLLVVFGLAWVVAGDRASDRAVCRLLDPPPGDHARRTRHPWLRRPWRARRAVGDDLVDDLPGAVRGDRVGRPRSDKLRAAPRLLAGEC